MAVLFQGSALLMLTPSEESYIDFLKINQKENIYFLLIIQLKEQKFNGSVTFLIKGFGGTISLSRLLKVSL